MKTYTILLLEWITKKTEPVEKITTDNIDDIESRLLELQKEHCVDEKPDITIEVFTSKGNKIKTLVANCESDFHYICGIEVVK